MNDSSNSTPIEVVDSMTMATSMYANKGEHLFITLRFENEQRDSLVDILLNDEKYLYDGKIIRELEGRVGYVSQYEKEEKDRDITVFEFLSEDFVRLQEENEAVCKEMETNFEDMEALLEKY
mgnify:CR=1 FL=1